MLSKTLFLQSLNITATFLPSNPRNLSIELPPLKQVKKQGSGILKLPIARQTSASSLARRQDSNILYNVGNSYLITCEIGTPGQQVFTLLDTGSSDLWVDPTCANSYNPSYCAAFPVYVPGQSSTATDAGKPFSLQYATGSATGEYLFDTVALGNADLLNQQFGYSENSTFPPTGIMGVGLGYGFGLDYYNIVDQLFSQGYTNSRAFSLDLASVDVSQGAIIFGGIDTNKYYGTLAKRPIIPYTEAPDGFPRYWLYLTSVGITEAGATVSNVLSGSGYTQPIFLDSGATLSQLPQTLFDALVAFFPTAVDTGAGLYSIDCSIRSQAGTLDFGFGPNIVKVPYHEWFYQAGQTCYFGGQPSTTIWSFGDSFLRSAYVVYDQDNFNIHIAQAANCGANVVSIGTGVDAVPSIAGCTSTGATSSSSLATSTSTVAPTTPPSSPTSTSPSSTFVISTSISTSTTPISTLEPITPSTTSLITPTSTLETTTPTIPRPSITPTSTVKPSTSSTAESSTLSIIESVTPTIPRPSTTPSSTSEPTPTLSTPATSVPTSLPFTPPTSTLGSISSTSTVPVASSTPSVKTGSSTPSISSSTSSSISGTSTFSTGTSITITPSTNTSSTTDPSTLIPTTTRPTVTYLIRPTPITSSTVDRIGTAMPNAQRRTNVAPFWRRLVRLGE